MTEPGPVTISDTVAQHALIACNLALLSPTLDDPTSDAIRHTRIELNAALNRAVTDGLPARGQAAAAAELRRWLDTASVDAGPWTDHVLRAVEALEHA
jgi:hypothetical protein